MTKVKKAKGTFSVAAAVLDAQADGLTAVVKSAMSREQGFNGVDIAPYEKISEEHYKKIFLRAVEKAAKNGEYQFVHDLVSFEAYKNAFDLVTPVPARRKKENQERINRAMGYTP